MRAVDSARREQHEPVGAHAYRGLCDPMLRDFELDPTRVYQPTARDRWHR
jgi:hypothetical protein